MTPTPPRHLDAEAKSLWKRLYPTMAVRLAETDLPNFELLCVNWSIVRRLDPTRDPKQGLLFMAAQKHFLALSKQFGLTPDARRRVDPPKKKKLSDALSALTDPPPIEKRTGERPTQELQTPDSRPEAGEEG